MRICHFSDTHLGAGENHPRRGQSGLTLRQEDIIGNFVDVVDRIINLKPDLCIHSGDLFHSVRPLNSIMAIAGRELYRLAEIQQIPTVIIAGNHDAPKQQHIGAALDVFRQIENLYISASGQLEIFEIKGASIFAVPHCLTAGSLKEQLARCIPDSKASLNVLVLHGVAAGMPEFSMADLGELELPLGVMERFDYTALGHFHNHCQVGPGAFYAGSSERLSQSEREAAKGFIEVNLNPFHLTFHEVASRPMVDLEAIDATGKRGDEVATLIKERLEQIYSGDKIVRVTIQGVTPEIMKTVPTDLISELKEKSFALDIRLEKQKDESADLQFGRSAIGRLDQSFLEYLDSVDLTGFDRERLRRDALKYLSSNE